MESPKVEHEYHNSVSGFQNKSRRPQQLNGILKSNSDTDSPKLPPRNKPMCVSCRIWSVLTGVEYRFELWMFVYSAEANSFKTKLQTCNWPVHKLQIFKSVSIEVRRQFQYSMPIRTLWIYDQQDIN